MLFKFNHRREITVVSANLDRLDRARLCLAHKHYIRCSGRDDAQEFMEAFDSLPKNPGGTVTATQDEFTIETMMQPPRSNTRLQGQGPSSILKMGASADLAAILKFLDVANPIVTDLAFDCNKANNTTGNAITLDGILGAWIERLYVQDAEGHMIRLQGTNRSCEDIWIVRNQGFAIDKQGIITATSKAIRIHVLHNHFENVDTDGVSAVINLYDGALNSEVIGNTIVGGQGLYAIEIGHGTVTADENVVAFNDIDTPQAGSGGGIMVWKGERNRVIGNHIMGCRGTTRGAISLLLAVAAEVGGRNIVTSAEGHGIHIDKSTLCDISHNTVYGASAGAANTYDSIHITDDGSTRSIRNKIVDNILEAVTASRARWGVYEDGAGSSNPDENEIVHNRIRNHQTGTISRHGANTVVKDNPGYTANAGAVNTGVTAVEHSDGYKFTTILTVSQVDALTIADLASLADGYLLYTFPAGTVVIDYAYMTMAMTAASTEAKSDTPDVGLGTVIASGAVATLNGTATFEDIITGQTAADANGTATVKTALPTAAVPFVIESGDAHTLHFNVADAWADDTGGDLTADIAGTVVVVWRFLA